MITRPLGSSGIQVSTVGVGTWAMGGWMWGGTDEAASVEAIQASIDAGVGLIDTAPAYGLGRSEEIVGRAIKGRRTKVVLATKCGLVWHQQKGAHFFDEAGYPVHRYLGAASIQYELEQSLRRLDTDYIDLYITHWQDSTTPVAETMGALLALKKAGKIRAIGVSNVSPAELSEYLKHGPVDAIQERYSLVDRQIETTLLPLCRKNNIAVLGYSSLALGLLAGPLDPLRKFTGDDQRANHPRFTEASRRQAAAFFQDIQPLIERLGATPAELIIAWTIAQPSITTALCGARNAAQAAQNARAGLLALREEDIAQIDAAAKKHLGAIAEQAS